MRQRPPYREDVSPRASRERGSALAPPTIAYLRGQGVTGFRVACVGGHCRRSAVVTFEAMGLGPDTPFPAIERSGRLVCSACGGRRVAVMPDWLPKGVSSTPARGWT